MPTRSFRDVLTRSRELRRRERLLWNQFAAELLCLIPKSLDTFVCACGWEQPEDLTAEWRFAHIVKQIALQSDEGHGVKLTIEQSRLGLYGFKDVSEVSPVLMQLQQAWQGLIDLHIQTNAHDVRITFFEHESAALRAKQPT